MVFLRVEIRQPGLRSWAKINDKLMVLTFICDRVIIIFHKYPLKRSDITYIVCKLKIKDKKR